MIRKAKRYSWPRKLYDKSRILAENDLVEVYGLKNKREIWKTEAKVNYFRTRAKNLITSDHIEQKKFFAKLVTIGLPVQTISDVLALNKEDLLKRRLSTVVWKKGLAKTAQHARQMIVHKKILIDGRVVNAPSHLVGVHEEASIILKPRAPRAQVETPMEVATNG